MKRTVLFLFFTMAIFLLLSCGGSKQSATQTTTVDTGGNKTPVISSLTASSKTVQVGATIGLTCDASDPDSDPLSTTWSSGGSGTFSPDPPIGVSVSWTAPSTAGSYTITCQVSDGKSTATASVDITVTTTSGNNSNPTITSGPTAAKTTLSPGEQTTVSVTASDPDGDVLSYNWTATGGKISPSGASATYTAPSVSGSYTVSVSVTDGRGGSATGSTTVSVSAPGNTPPTIASFLCDSASLVPGAETTCTVSASDPDNDTLNYTYSATLGQVTGNGNSATYTAPSQETTDTLTVTVSDGNGGTATASFSIAVATLKPLVHRIIAAGRGFTCAVSSGEVFCWGYNNGQLGNGTTVDSSVPVKVTGISTAVEVDAGVSTACALLSSGKVKCWGRGFGSSPVEVTGITNAISVAAGEDSIYFALASGGVLESDRYFPGWSGPTQTSSEAYRMVSAGGGRITLWSVFAGIREGESDLYISTSEDTSGFGHTCIVRQTGEVDCQGDNGDGQLGDGTTTASTTYVSTGITNGIAVEVNSISYSYGSSCAVLSTGEVQCWGDNSSGQLGTGTQLSSSTPVNVKGINSAKAVTVGIRHACAVLQSGKIMCWGDNSYGQLGDGTTQSSDVPVEVQGLTIASRQSFWFALKARFFQLLAGLRGLV